MYLDQARRKSEAVSQAGTESPGPRSAAKSGEVDLYNMPAEAAEAFIQSSGLAGEQAVGTKLVGGLAAGWSETEARDAFDAKRR